jgi:hypothetical protein
MTKDYFTMLVIIFLGSCGIFLFVYGGLSYANAGQESPCKNNEDFFEVGINVITEVVKVCDNETRTVCYLVPNQHCVGDCAYTPAISCVRY